MAMLEPVTSVAEKVGGNRSRATVPVHRRAIAPRRHTVGLVLPTLNELQGLQFVLPHIDRSMFDEIILVDGGSNDGTVEYAMANDLTVVSQLRPGLEFAIFDLARAIDYDYLIEFSPDGNCKSEDLAALVAELQKGYDMVVVSRYLAHAVSEDDHPVSAFGNWMFSRLMRPLADFPITDALTIYRGYSRKIVLDPDFEFYLKGPVFEPLVTGICALRGLRATEIPGDEPKRIGGVTKRGIFYNGSLVLLMVIRLYLRKFFNLRV